MIARRWGLNPTLGPLAIRRTESVMLHSSRLRKKITPAQIYEAFSYDPLTGKLTWKERPIHHFFSDTSARIWNTKHAGKETGHKCSSGYLSVNLWGFQFYVHRLAFVLMTGNWPEHQIDHVNGDRADNRFSNLRSATHKQNTHNAKKSKANTVGLKGVSQCPKCKTFRAQIYSDGKLTHLGTFKTKEEAHAAYAQAAINLRGGFARVS